MHWIVVQRTSFFLFFFCCTSKRRRRRPSPRTIHNTARLWLCGLRRIWYGASCDKPKAQTIFLARLIFLSCYQLMVMGYWHCILGLGFTALCTSKASRCLCWCCWESHTITNVHFHDNVPKAFFLGLDTRTKGFLVYVLLWRVHVFQGYPLVLHPLLLLPLPHRIINAWRTECAHSENCSSLKLLLRLSAQRGKSNLI